MEDFFRKYPMKANEMTAIKLIHKQIECAQKKLKEDKKSTEYMKDLAIAYHMLCDFFREKGYDPDNYTP